MSLTSYKKCIINTGNILSLNEITKKSGLTTTDELTEAINITAKEFQNNGIKGSQNSKLLVNRSSDDLKAKIKEHDLSNLKIGFKIFINNDDKALVQEAIEEGLAALNVPHVQSVVLQFKRDKVIAGGDDMSSLKKIWNVLEEYVKNSKISQIGLSDVEEGTFISIFEWANVKPSIIQINLSTCCVVPPTLQTFCKENDVQLLTHSDSSDILLPSVVPESLGVALPINWVLRFLVHIQCRGVLCSKGYLVGLGEI